MLVRRDPLGVTALDEDLERWLLFPHLRRTEQRERLENRLIMRLHWVIVASYFNLLPLAGKRTTPKLTDMIELTARIVLMLVTLFPISLPHNSVIICYIY